MDDLITADEAAKLLHLHVKRVQFLARSGELPAVRFGRKWLFSRGALLAAQRPSATHAATHATAPAADGALEISARNRLRGRVVAIIADGVMAEVRLQIGDQELVSIITRSSAERLRLAVGAEVLAVIKSTEIMIAREASGS
jgi:molybdopterin-binding protein